MLLKKIASRIDIKLGLLQTFILLFSISGLFGALTFLQIENRGLQNERMVLLQDMNNKMRYEIVRLQDDLLEISGTLDSDPIHILTAWIDKMGVSPKILHGRDNIKSIYTKRKERRDISKSGKLVIKELNGVTTLGMGIFEDGTFTKNAHVYYLPKISIEVLSDKVNEIQKDATSQDAIKKKILSIKAHVADSGLEAENARSEIVAAVDILNVKDAELHAQTNWTYKIMAGLGIGSIMLIVTAIYFTGRFIVTKSLVKLQETTRAIAAGKDASIPYVERTDEVGSLARAVARFQEASKEADLLREAQEADKEASRLKTVARLSKVSDQLTAGMDYSFNDLNGLTERLAQLTKEIEDATGKTSAQSENVSQHSNDNSQIAIDITDFAHELKSQTSKLSQVIEEHKSQTSATLEDTHNVQEQVSALNQSASEVEDIVKIIADIADQTNLLALNATIEASRAGVSGNGFAVVANEVKNLARHSADSAGKISDKVKRMKSITQDTINAIESVGTRVDSLHGAMETLIGEFQSHEILSEQISIKTSNSRDTASELSAAGRQMIDVVETSNQATMRLTETTNAILTSINKMQTELSNTLSTARGAAE